MSSHHYLSACLVFKNSASYLAEWLAFYRVLGVEHFYLYDNDSTDDYRRITARYVENGSATVVTVHGGGVQKDVYETCLKNHGSTTRWMMFCDDDEFLYPCADVCLHTALKPYEKFAGVAVSWMLYGSSGHRERPKGLVISNYTRRFALPDQHVKCIVDPSRIEGCVLVAHEFKTKFGGGIVDERGEPMAGPFRSQPTADTFRINHYLTKSTSEMEVRRSTIQVNTGKVSPLSVADWLKLECAWNQVEDLSAHRYVSRVEVELQRMEKSSTPLPPVQSVSVKCGPEVYPE